jgi:glutathione S-transferase
MYVLYYSPGSASFAVHWLLIELGAPFEARRLDLDAREGLTEWS